ncbi:glycosyltransferase family 4 protein [Halomonas sp. NO4]|uniref:glycosyltransferase family 4 protein n=1 Tax=Halomonas sp. NO4 TaxID=2484813 RepID=UPI0023E45F9D|nr:glycosyltransferase family 4 protein [Halomonas sp. NO4]
MPSYCFVDRENAHSIWSLVDIIAGALLAKGDDVIYCRFCDQPMPIGRSVPYGVIVNDVPVPPKRSCVDLIKQHYVFAKALTGLLKSKRIDVLHAHFAIPSIVSRWVGYNVGLPVLLTTQHELYGSMNPYLRIGLGFTQRYCNAAVYVSDQVAMSFSPFAGLAQRDVVIKNGIDVHSLQALSSPRPMLEQRLRIICAGRFVSVKGQKTLIEAWPRVLESFPEAHLCLPGDGPEKALLENRCRALCIAPTVEFPGWLPRNETLQRICGSTLMVVPSDGTQEGFGLVVAEAMALGVPIVCSDIPVFREVAADTVGYFPVGDAAALAQAIITTLSQLEQAHARAEWAQQRVAKHFDQRDMVAAYLHLYDDLLGNRTRHDRITRDCDYYRL